MFSLCSVVFLALLATLGQQPPGGCYLGWILFSFFLHHILIPLALDHLARLVAAGLLSGVN